MQQKNTIDASSHTRPGPLNGPVALYAFTPRGLDTALTLAGSMRASLYASISLKKRIVDSNPARAPRFFSDLPALMRETFRAYSCHIFIGATGIAVRAIAPHLESKFTDPAVLVVDQQARFVISLLSGHCGGANSAAAHVSRILGATPVISTATDIEGLPAVDLLATERGLAMANPEAAKAVSAALLAGESVSLLDPAGWLGLRAGRWARHFTLFDGLEHEQDGSGPGCEAACLENGVRAGIAVSVYARPEAGGEKILFLHPPALAVGIGCKRGTQASGIVAFVREVFAGQGLSLASLRALASFDAKRDEAGLREAARILKVRLRLYSREQLAAYPVASVSDKALETFGIPGVCEPAALAAAGEGSEKAPSLLVPKSKSQGITLAVALRNSP